jgi:hypothetical protein
VKRIYTASGLSEAYLMRDFLAIQGIPTLVFNEHSAGALGEIPCNETLPQLWIQDESRLERARSLIVDYERAATIEDPREWQCPRCAEANPASFEICWRCGAAEGD